MPNTNPIVPLGWEEQVHRETYIAILKGQLRKPGAKKAFAAEIGISPQYLSYLLDPYDHRSPSQGMAQAIVRALSLTEHERSHMLEHLILAGGRASPAVHGQTYDDLPATMRGDDEVEGWGAHVQQLYEHAMITRDPEMARVHTTTSAQTARHFLHTVDPWQHPLVYAEVALVLHEINSMRNQLSRAIYYAKRARLILSHADEAKLQAKPTRAMAAMTNALRCEAVVYNNLALHKAALELLNQAEGSPGAMAAPGFWIPQVFRDRLAALGGMRRIALGEAERVTRQGAEWAAREGGPDTEILIVLLERGLSSVYMRHGRPEQAQRLALRLMEQVGQAPRSGPFHKALVAMNYAETLWRTQRWDEWRHVMADTIHLAVAAELSFVLARIRTQYGAAVAPLFADLDSSLIPQVVAAKGGGA